MNQKESQSNKRTLPVATTSCQNSVVKRDKSEINCFALLSKTLKDLFF